MMLVIAGVISSCKKDDDDDDMNTSQNIVELAQTNSNLSSLVAAVQKAGLVDALSDESKNYTVFAPTNAAFDAFLSANGFSSLDAVPVDVLTKVLLNHVIAAEVKSADISTGYVKTLATYGSTTSNISMYISTAGGVVMLNGGAMVTTADVDANNGVVHVIDEVIGLPVIPTFAVSNPNFSILVQALTRSDLSANYATVLSGSGPFTVFAPTNDAFAAVLTELGVSSLSDIDAATLEKVLTYHVVSGNVLEDALTEGQTVTTLETGTFTIGLSGGAKITDENGRVSNIVATDVQGTNGVVHVVDKVLLPQ
jgi:uncharacterized surface protein with fasciclin (FAS1) repeats